MGGPWRERGFDPRGWRPPRARVTAESNAAQEAAGHRLLWIVVGYVVAVFLSLGAMITAMVQGW
jgi:hypothetical protein